MQKLDKTENCCRICYESYFPLKKLPCSCKGSLSYIHDFCLNEMLHVKMEDEKEDSPNGIQQNNSYDEVKVKCEICLEEIFLDKTIAIKLEKLSEIKAEIYFVLFCLICLSCFGVQIAMNLFEKAQHNDDLTSKVLYTGAFSWIAGVIFYVMFEPLYEEIKVTTFSMKSNQLGLKIKHNSKKRVKDIFESERHENRLSGSKKERISFSEDEEEKNWRSKVKEKNKRKSFRCFEI